ncbi:MAG: NAD(P)/FAD-dependent oxidoreductase [Chloroflexi bacterium]|nr:NAD(P)/FAD-dependent oxidoreductase [Chloroflexota bacterium]
MNSDSQHEEVDAVVVGGGMAGLTVAAYVARAGRSVVVLERSSRTGGRAITEERNGYYFNLGPHALYTNGFAATVLNELGVDVSGGEPPQAGFALKDGRLHKLPVGPISLLSTSLFGLGAKLEFGRIFAELPRINASAADGLSLEEWLTRNTNRSAVGDLLRAVVRLATYANDPKHLSAGVAIAQLQMALKGVLYLDHGWQTLVDGVQAQAVEAGARIETGASVLSVEQEGPAITVLLEDGRLYRTSTVILATPPKTAAELLGAAGADLSSRAEAAEPVRVATLDVGLSETPRPDARFVLGIDQPLYLSIHSGVGNLSPPGGTMLHVAKYLGDDTTGAKDVERELEGFLDLAQPGWRDVLVEHRFLPNLIVVNALATAGTGGLRGRPDVATDVKGVHLAGDWVGGEGWLVDASLASAKRAASAALESMPAPARQAVVVGAV